MRQVGTQLACRGWRVSMGRLLGLLLILWLIVSGLLSYSYTHKCGESVIELAFVCAQLLMIEVVLNSRRRLLQLDHK